MAKVLEGAPTLIMTFVAHQNVVIRDRTGAIKEGKEVSIVLYCIVFTAILSSVLNIEVKHVLLLLVWVHLHLPSKLIITGCRMRYIRRYMWSRSEETQATMTHMPRGRSWRWVSRWARRRGSGIQYHTMPCYIAATQYKSRIYNEATTST